MAAAKRSYSCSIYSLVFRWRRCCGTELRHCDYYCNVFSTTYFTNLSLSERKRRCILKPVFVGPWLPDCPYLKYVIRLALLIVEAFIPSKTFKNSVGVTCDNYRSLPRLHGVFRAKSAFLSNIFSWREITPLSLLGSLMRVPAFKCKVVFHCIVTITSFCFLSMLQRLRL